MGFCSGMSVPVLLVAEDNDTDAVLLERALRRSGSAFRMVRVRNGTEAIAYVEGSGPYANRAEYPFPSMILLDLRMPQKDGFDVLHWRQHRTGGSRLPVVVFTSSELNIDVERALDLGANSYVVKPTAPGRLEIMVAALEDWWMRFNVTANPLAG